MLSPVFGRPADDSNGRARRSGWLPLRPVQSRSPTTQQPSRKTWIRPCKTTGTACRRACVRGEPPRAEPLRRRMRTMTSSTRTTRYSRTGAPPHAHPHASRLILTEPRPLGRFQETAPRRAGEPVQRSVVLPDPPGRADLRGARRRRGVRALALPAAAECGGGAGALHPVRQWRLICPPAAAWGSGHSFAPRSAA